MNAYQLTKKYITISIENWPIQMICSSVIWNNQNCHHICCFINVAMHNHNLTKDSMPPINGFILHNRCLLQQHQQQNESRLYLARTVLTSRSSSSLNFLRIPRRTGSGIAINCSTYQTTEIHLKDSKTFFSDNQHQYYHIVKVKELLNCKKGMHNWLSTKTTRYALLLTE